MAKPINPSSLFELPVKSFSHGMHVPAGAELLFVSGEVGARKDLTIPEGVTEQTELAFRNIEAVLAEAGMGFEHVVKLNGYLVDTDDYAAFSSIRDRFLEGCSAASTVVFVKALVFPQLKVEIEAVAAKSP
jgi:enamine deaminase RidA (YjgF/YER057c/UK114 family)